MDIKRAEKARELLNNLKKLRNIEETLNKERGKWWSILSPELARTSVDGLKIPDILKNKFYEAVVDSIKEVEEELDKL